MTVLSHLLRQRLPARRRADDASPATLSGVRPTPRLVALVGIAVATLSTAGCSTFSVQPITEYYKPADGEMAELGPDVSVANVFIAAEEAGAPGALVARVVNDGPEPVSVRIASDEADVDLTVDVASGEMVEIGPDGEEQVLIERVEAIPGTLVPFVAAVEGQDLSAELLVPVFDGTLPRFEELIPTTGPTS